MCFVNLLPVNACLVEQDLLEKNYQPLSLGEPYRCSLEVYAAEVSSKTTMVDALSS